MADRKFTKGDLRTNFTEAKSSGKKAKGKKRLTEAKKGKTSSRTSSSNEPIPW